MMFSWHIDMIYENSALQDIFVKLLLIEYRLSKKVLPIWESIHVCIMYDNKFFFQACERAESSKSCSLIGSESGGYFTILPANPRGIVGSFIHKFICCLWMSKNRHFQTIFLLKLALLLALAREKWILLFIQKIWRENQASQPGNR